MRDPSEHLAAILALQRKAYFAHPVPTLAERKADLRSVRRLITENRDALCDAINQDYGHRSRHETLLSEIVPAIDAIDHALSHLAGWMQPQRRRVDQRSFFGATNRVIPQPLGVVGVIVPWNFPINLSIIPLVAILAAGNRAMIKMSEKSRQLARLLIALGPTYLPADKLQFFDETGGVGVLFSQLRFDHLLFTGSGQTGRAVMAAAAQTLCPVTLELGGKSPALLAEDYPVGKAAERILFAKFLNAGQICTAVDHLYLPAGKTASFVAAAKSIMPRRYPSLASPDYTAIIDQRAFQRLINALAEARAGGAEILPLVPGPSWDTHSRKIAPHIVLNAPAGCSLLTREIFGPILPLIEYATVDEVILRINDGPRPLAFYPFSNDRRLIGALLQRVMSGGVSVNDALLHVAQHDLPFGGVGESGMGHYHGREGFLTFSKLRPVFHQASFSVAQFLAPPYGRFADRVLAILSR